MKTALVCGAGGFIGSHMVNRLKSEGYWVRGVDVKRPEFSPSQADEFEIFDLRNPYNYQILRRIKEHISENFDEVYLFAADMGGAGYVFTGEHDADIMHNSAMINLNILNELSKMDFKGKIFYSSSACMYPQELQTAPDGKIFLHHFGLQESDAYPANPDSEYGWEKLFSERLYLAYQRNKNLNVRIARFHNIYGPEGTYEGGREKAPASMCRKVIKAFYGTQHGVVEVWGTGHQTRSFLYIDDCIDAVRLLMESDFCGPVNIGSEEMVTIDELAKLAITFAGNPLALSIHHTSGPTGVMGRNSNNDLIRQKLGWEPKYSLLEGMKLTFSWISNQVKG